MSHSNSDPQHSDTAQDHLDKAVRDVLLAADAMEHARDFLKHKVEYKDLPALTTHDLYAIGVEALGKRKRILKAISDMQELAPRPPIAVTHWDRVIQDHSDQLDQLPYVTTDPELQECTSLTRLFPIHVEADIGPEAADTLRNDLHKDLKADFIIANPPFNDSDWFRKDDDVRLQWSGATWSTRQGCPKGERGGVHPFGVPPTGNANLALVQHLIHHLAPQGMAGLVLANRSTSSSL